jgi:hypothetical protein
MVAISFPHVGHRIKATGVRDTTLTANGNSADPQQMPGRSTVSNGG